MRTALREALAECMARLEAGAEIEDCLRGQEALAAELRPLLEAAQALRARQGDIEGYTPQAFQRGRARMHSERARQAEGGVRASLFPWVLLGRPARVLAVAAVVALLAVLGFTTGLFRFGADTTSADVQGVVSRVDPDAITLTTDDGLVIIHIGENTIVLDANGNVISGAEIVPGKPATVEVEKDNGDLAAQLIEVTEEDDGSGSKVEFSGVIMAVDGSSITVQASFGLATVHIDSQTEVKGTLAAGATAEVHATVRGDGSYLAREIEVKGSAGADDGGRDGDDNDVGDDGADEADEADGGDGDDGGDDRSGNSGPGPSGSGTIDAGPGDGDQDGHGDGDEKKDDEKKDDDKKDDEKKDDDKDDDH